MPRARHEWLQSLVAIARGEKPLLHGKKTPEPFVICPALQLRATRSPDESPPVCYHTGKSFNPAPSGKHYRYAKQEDCPLPDWPEAIACTHMLRALADEMMQEERTVLHDEGLGEVEVTYRALKPNPPVFTERPRVRQQQRVLGAAIANWLLRFL